MNILSQRKIIKGKIFVTIIEELKQRIIAVAAKLSRYQKRIHQYQENRLIETDPSFYKQIYYGEWSIKDEKSNAEEA